MNLRFKAATKCPSWKCGFFFTQKLQISRLGTLSVWNKAWILWEIQICGAELSSSLSPYTNPVRLYIGQIKYGLWQYLRTLESEKYIFRIWEIQFTEIQKSKSVGRSYTAARLLTSPRANPVGLYEGPRLIPDYSLHCAHPHPSPCPRPPSGNRKMFRKS